MSDEQKATSSTAAIGTLYIVSTPIGNDDDITLRATRILKHCDVVACEEIKVGAKVLKRLNVSAPIIELNEHTEDYANDEVIAKLLGGENVALISDCGTPIFADPGQGLLKRAFAANAPVVVVPGVTSIMTALTRSGLSTDSFVYAGFMSRKPEERREQLRQLAAEIRTVVFLETPYRVVPLLVAIAEIIPTRRAYVGCNLTMPFESHHYGQVAEIVEKLMAEKFKGEAVICIEGAPSEVRGGIRRKAAAKHIRIAEVEDSEVEDNDEMQEFSPDNDEFPEMRPQHSPNIDDNEIEIDFDEEDDADDVDEVEIDFDEEDDTDDVDEIEIDFDEEDDTDDEDGKPKHGPTKPRFDNKPRPGGYKPRLGGGDREGGRRFDDRKPRFGGGDREGGRGFDDRKPRFGGGDREGGRRFDDRKPRFGGGDREGGRGFDDRKPRFGGGDR
ncbi:MAG: 16S rRNA (cytidine(1402)-2'-O)-methyltransferase, partial [Bacteroidetes bacterium]|nr:16S rRNA (cytidine(1402)-2'-O)-methyltransferase [Bacteroidota bacterium]